MGHIAQLRHNNGAPRQTRPEMDQTDGFVLACPVAIFVGATPTRCNKNSCSRWGCCQIGGVTPHSGVYRGGVDALYQMHRLGLSVRWPLGYSRIHAVLICACSPIVNFTYQSICLVYLVVSGSTSGIESDSTSRHCSESDSEWDAQSDADAPSGPHSVMSYQLRTEMVCACVK